MPPVRSGIGLVREEPVARGRLKPESHAGFFFPLFTLELELETDGRTRAGQVWHAGNFRLGAGQPVAQALSGAG